jgi:hypothetical protein
MRFALNPLEMAALELRRPAVLLVQLRFQVTYKSLCDQKYRCRHFFLYAPLRSVLHRFQESGASLIMNRAARRNGYHWCT